MSPTGVVGLIHPESHFTEAAAGELRRQTYSRLRRHWQFRNEQKLFAEINDTRQYGLHIYAGTQPNVNFLHATWLYHPETIDRSLHHDGTGPEPGIKTAEGHWDSTPHGGRIQRVTRDVLSNWADLLDAPGTPTEQARMVYSVNQ